jgi:hypothetical protein
MKELERVKEFMETLEFHGYIDHDPTKLKQLIDDYYPIKQGKNLPLDSVSVSFEEGYEKGYREATTEAFQEIGKNYQPNER